MGLFTFFSKPALPQDSSIIEKLDKIDYFELVDNSKKKDALKSKIEFDYSDDSNEYIGKGWLTFPNDYYISSVNDLPEYQNGSSTSDFRAFEVWASSLFRGEFQDYLESAKVVFEKNNLTLQWKDEIFDENTTERIHHRITVNGIERIIFSGEVSRDNIGNVMKQYLNSFRQILNNSIEEQNKDYRVVLVTQPEYVVFVLLDTGKLKQFKEIVSQAKNKVED